MPRKKKFNTGIFIGRFQPFHKGHLHAIAYASRLCERLIIGVGSSQVSSTPKNPLTASARIRIMSAGIGKRLISEGKISFMEIPDFGDDDAWFEYIKDKEPGIKVVFSRNRLVKSIFKHRGIMVVSPNWYRRDKLSATVIRKLMRNGARWWQRVPEGSAKEIEKEKSKILRSLH